MEKFCEYLKEHAMKIINYGKKNKDTINKWRGQIIPITKTFIKLEIIVIMKVNTGMLYIAYAI